MNVKNAVKNMAMGGIYGALQDPMDRYLSSKLTPYLGMAGPYAGNAARGLTLFGIGKFVKNKTARDLATKGLIVEGADIGKSFNIGGGGASLSSNNASGTIHG